jgi:hypothetical protein
MLCQDDEIIDEDITIVAKYRLWMLFHIRKHGIDSMEEIHIFHLEIYRRPSTVMRFPGTGITFGRYAGYSCGEYPSGTGQTVNYQFDDIYAKNCRVGIVINSPNFLQVHFNRLLVAKLKSNMNIIDVTSFR